MHMDDKAIEKAELVIKALEYAHNHKLDINDRSDVKKILEILDVQPINEKEVEEFMNLLQNADTLMEMTALRKETKKTDLPN